MDPLALHHVVVKDQYVYEETDSFIIGNKVLFGTGLLSTLGDHHRKQRKMLNPVFSLKHMRGMISIFNPISIQLREVLSEQVRLADGQDVNVMKWLSRAALEFIGQGGLGYAFHALDDTKTDTYSETLKRLGCVRVFQSPSTWLIIIILRLLAQDLRACSYPVSFFPM